MAIKSLRPRHTRSQNQAAGSQRLLDRLSSFIVLWRWKRPPFFFQFYFFFFCKKVKMFFSGWLNLNLVNNKWRRRRRLFFLMTWFWCPFSKLAGKVEMSHPMNVFFFFYLLKLSFLLCCFCERSCCDVVVVASNRSIILWPTADIFFFSGGFLEWRESYRRGGFLTGFFFIHSSKIK